eukprot:CAMPEP_0204362418 /NCGR_PEP_ID=MMETSP0469-20131031/39579_1 /ASSEMBLY_ACC=CAM_ASM_000384 /TAXON_ID=2969 /ORGANISM="Oxyrrhis marina" /LENGTH=44 /DNA_ID= /DNA_START= /DNA_END= /DNA_ORIENTATION=
MAEKTLKIKGSRNPLASSPSRRRALVLGAMAASYKCKLSGTVAG